MANMTLAHTALAGTACGDAFGAPFEFQANAPEMAWNSMNESRYLCSKNDVGQPNPGFWRMPGVYTDDTQQSLLLHWLFSNTEEAPRKGKDIRKQFLRWSQVMAREDVPDNNFGIHRGTGGNFRNAIRQGGPVKTAGLGGPMRIGPVVTMIDDPALVIPWVHQVTLATTNDPLSLAGTILFAMVCWREAHLDDDLSAEDWGQIPQNLAPAWEKTLHAVRLLHDHGEEKLVKWAMKNGSNKKLTCAADGFALTGVPWAIVSAMETESYSQALLKAASSGGDTDTVCAMAGCLSAIRLGKDSIPAWMREGLMGRDHIDNPSTWDPIKSELPLTKADVSFRQKLTP